MLHQRTLGKSHLAAMMVSMLAGIGAVHGGHATTRRLFESGTRRRKVNTHPMITASDLEISEWNRLVNTRQVIRRRTRPWEHGLFQKMTKMVKAGHP